MVQLYWQDVANSYARRLVLCPPDQEGPERLDLQPASGPLSIFADGGDDQGVGTAQDILPTSASCNTKCSIKRRVGYTW